MIQLVHRISIATALYDPYGPLRQVTSDILAFLIRVIAVLLAISIATGFLEGQVAYLTGSPQQLSTVLSALWFKVGAVIICLFLALVAVSISNTLVGILF